MAREQKQSVTSVIRNYSNKLFRFIRGRVSNQEDAEDILQDIWVSLNSIVDLETIENMNAWLFRNARNRIVDRYRKKNVSTSTDDLSDESSELFLSTEILPDDEFFQEVIWEEVMNALDELPPKQRDVFVKNELDGLTLQEIADESGDKLKTIISRKRYAVIELRRRLQRIYNELNEL